MKHFTFVCLLFAACGDDDRAVRDAGSTPAVDSGAEPADGGAPTGDAGELTAPATAFCECSRSMPLPMGGAFQGCATMRSDGIGTYFTPAPYMRTADAETQPGVPVGTVTSLTIGPSDIYPGVTHSASVYVPAQYDGSSPAALLVLLDGSVYADNDAGAPYRAPTVLDNLIAEGAMPVTIAVFVDEGYDGAGNTVRSLEYDTPDDRFARFVHDELLPATVSEYSITTDPDRRAIGGRSSGGCGSWGVAWVRPDSFRLVYTTVGSFTRQMANEAGEFADIYPMWVASMPAKPIRVTLLSGVNDLTTEAGVWSEAHMTMTTALDCAGYAYRSGFGDIGHDDYDVGSEFGRDLRFLFANAR